MFTVCAEAPRRVGGVLNWVIVNIHEAEIIARSQSSPKHCNAVDVCSILAWRLDSCAIFA